MHRIALLSPRDGAERTVATRADAEASPRCRVGSGRGAPRQRVVARIASLELMRYGSTRDGSTTAQQHGRTEPRRRKFPRARHDGR